MEHHPKYEHSRFLGDKRTQLVYDLDSWDDEAVINEIVDEGVGSVSAPTPSPRPATVATRWRRREPVDAIASRGRDLGAVTCRG
jgi:hypothetical protein